MVRVDICYNIRYGKLDFDDILHLCVFWLYVRVTASQINFQFSQWHSLCIIQAVCGKSKLDESENISEYLISVLQHLTVYFSRLQ